MRSSTILLCFVMLGCFRTIDTGPGGPGVPPPLGRDTGPRTDLGPWSRDTGPGPRDSGPIGFFDSAVPDGAIPDGAIPDGAIPDASICPQCELDSDCPEAPPFGCGQAVCVAGACAVGVGSCTDGEACDQDELVCTPEALELTVRLQTDYVAFTEFDRVVLEVGGRVVFQDTALVGDPLVGLDYGPLWVREREMIEVELTIYRACEEVVSRRVLVEGDGPVSLTIVVPRDVDL